jgi:UDP-glucose 4-epimerase
MSETTIPVMVKILITGASGLLGQHLLPLLNSDHEVLSVRRLVEKPSPTCVSLDFSRPWTSEALPKRIDVVIHLAQSARYRDFPDGAGDVFAVNLASTAQILDYARTAGAKRFILASTGGIYRANSSPITEDSELLGPAELGHYFATKLAAEMIAGNYRQFMDVHVLRIFFMYGPGQRKEMFLPTLIQRIKSGGSVRLNGEHGIRINPIHAQDAARAVVELAHKGGPKTLNLAGPQSATIREIAEMIGKCLNVTPSFMHTDEAGDLVANTDAIHHLINDYQFDMHQGLASLLVDLT